MSNCSANSISPGSMGCDFNKSSSSNTLGNLVHSPAQATSVPSHHCAVSPQDGASNDGFNSNGLLPFTSDMANAAATAMELKKFDSLLSWYQATKDKTGVPEKTPGDESSNLGDAGIEKKPLKRKVEAEGADDLPVSMKRHASSSSPTPTFGFPTHQPGALSAPTASSQQNQQLNQVLPLPKPPPLPSCSVAFKASKKDEDNPLRKMERMTNLSAFDSSSIGDVVGGANCAKSKESERMAKLQKLGEIGQQLGMTGPDDPILMDHKAEWDRMVGSANSSSAPPMSSAPGAQRTSAQASPVYPTAPGFGPSGSLSAGAYPAPFAYQGGPMQPSGPISAGAYPPHSAMFKNSAAHADSAGAARAAMHPGMHPMGFPGFPHGMPHPGMQPQPGMPMDPRAAHHPMYHYQYHQMMAAHAQRARLAAGISPGSYPPPMRPPASGAPASTVSPLPGIAVPSPYGPAMGIPPGRYPVGAYPPGVQPPPPYGYHPGIPYPGGYPPHPSMMHPGGHPGGMMVPRPAIAHDPNTPANFAGYPGIPSAEKDDAKPVPVVPDPVAAAS